MRRSLFSLSLPLLLAACGADPGDPYGRAGTWQPERVNEANLRAMVADPRDLAIGRNAWGSAGQTAALAVTRLRADRVKPLPDSGLAKVVISGASQSAPAGAP